MRDERCPLVSMCMPVYNRPDYVREALQSALDQTYDPLEIVISDNCSTDDTPKIVQEMIDAYKAKGGTHTFVFNRNSENIGGGKNIAKTFQLAHGELLVPAHDDDVSLPTRVEKIVAAWEASGRKATVIGHDVISIDAQGMPYEVQTVFCAEHPCSAVHTYSRSLIDTPFTPFDENAMIEDIVYQCRAQMIGPYVKVNEPLLMYRTETGVSSSATDWRLKNKMINPGTVKACVFLRDDLKDAKGWISHERYLEASRIVDHIYDAFYYQAMLFSGETFKERFEGYRHNRVPFRLSPGLLSYLLVQTLCLFPNPVFDKAIDMIMRLKQCMHKRFARKAFVAAYGEQFERTQQRVS